MADQDGRQQIRPFYQAEPTGRPVSEGRFERRFSDRPLGYPNALIWLRAGILRDWRGVLGAFVATWFYVPVALLVAFWWGVLSLFLAPFVGAFGGGQLREQVPTVLRDAPLVGPLLEAFLGRAGGVVGVFLLVVGGFLGPFLLVLLLPWASAFDEPVNLFTGLIGTALAAALLGVAYTVGRIMLEPRLLGVSGARQLSRREAARLRPILEDCARRLDLPNVPRLLMEDDPVLTNARAYARHVVVSTAVLEEPDENIAALLSHELVHWRTGDEVTSAFIRGVGLPLVLAHALPTWLMRRFPHPATDFLVFVVFWPVLVTMRFLVLPCHRRDVRAAEYRADAGAVVAGHADGMREMLERRRSFETGRSGWDEAVCATHPPAELRLDRLTRLTEASQAEVTAAAGETPAAPGPLHVDEIFDWRNRSGSRRAWLVIGALLLVSCFGGGVLTAAQWMFFRPQAAVDDYFSALGDHDGRAALRLLTPNRRAQVGNEDQLVRIIEARSYQPPTDVHLTKLERRGDEAIAEVSFGLAGQKSTALLSLRRDDRATLGLFHRWRIEVGPALLNPPDGRVGLAVNGVPVSVAPEGGTVPLLPGAYTVDGQRNALSEIPSQVVVALPGQEDLVKAELSPTLVAGAQAAAEETVRTYLDTCAVQLVAAPIACPFQYYNGSEVKQIAWKITSYPTLELKLTGPTTARVTTTSGAAGSVRATGTRTDYLGRTSPFTEDDTFNVNGVLVLVDGKLTFRPVGE